MPHSTTVVFLTLLVASSALSLQTPQSPGASIHGTVTRLDTGAPVAGAQVTLSVLSPLMAALQANDVATFQALQAAQPTALTQPTQIPPVTTDSEGKFAFNNLNAGTYNILTTASGFVRQQYGQRTPNGQGTPFPLAANQTMKDVALRLTPTGTVSGRILDENGQPAMGIPVQLLRQVYNPTGKVYQAVASISADDRGQYRMFGVTPGRYYLAIGNPPGPPRIVSTGGVITQPGSMAYALAYFPGVAAVED